MTDADFIAAAIAKMVAYGAGQIAAVVTDDITIDGVTLKGIISTHCTTEDGEVNFTHERGADDDAHKTAILDALDDL